MPYELRVGNIVAIPTYDGHYDHEPLTAWQIYQFTKFKQGDDDVPSYYELMYPIRITKYYLEKLGFQETVADFMEIEVYMEQGKKEDDIKRVSIIYDLRSDECFIEIFFFLRDDNYQISYEADMSHVKYVHQIQNIVCDMCGTDPELIKQEESLI